MYEIFENKLFLEETLKKITWFFLLHPVTFYGKKFEKQKYLELITSLFELQDMHTKIPFVGLTYPLNVEAVEREGKNDKILNKQGKKYLKIFKMLSFGKTRKIGDTSFKACICYFLSNFYFFIK